LFADTDYGPSAVQQGEVDGWKTGAYAFIAGKSLNKFDFTDICLGGIVENLIAAIPPILEHKFQQIRHSCF
jgi:hypothetical protein